MTFGRGPCTLRPDVVRRRRRGEVPRDRRFRSGRAAGETAEDSGVRLKVRRIAGEPRASDALGSGAMVRGRELHSDLNSVEAPPTPATEAVGGTPGESERRSVAANSRSAATVPRAAVRASRESAAIQDRVAARARSIPCARRRASRARHGPRQCEASCPLFFSRGRVPECHCDTGANFVRASCFQARCSTPRDPLNLRGAAM